MLSDSGHGSQTLNEVPLKVLKELARTPLQRIGAGVLGELSNASELGDSSRGSLTSSGALIKVVKKLVRSRPQLIYASVINDSCRNSLTSILMTTTPGASSGPATVATKSTRTFRHPKLRLDLAKTALKRDDTGDLGE